MPNVVLPIIITDILDSPNLDEESQEVLSDLLRKLRAGELLTREELLSVADMRERVMRDVERDE
jgi:hypothetical protein